jgi:putative glycosyl hydrolase-like family 15 (GHL15) protein
MSWLRPTHITIATVLLALAGTSATAVTAPVSAADPAGVTAGSPVLVRSFWFHMNSTPTPDAMLTTEAKRRGHIVLNAWEGALIPKLKQANPAIQVFVYKDLSSTRSYACRNGVDDVAIPTGIGYCYAQRNHPEWFLLDPSGRRFEYSGYAGHWQMDVGNTAYQQMWADNVIASSKKAGFDGVFMDNALFPCDAYHEGICPNEYPTTAAFQNAYKAMFANTRNKFTAAGLRTVANLSNARLYDGAWDAYSQYLDGGFDEWWLTFDNNNLLSEYPQGWSRQVAEIATNQARGKLTWVQPHFTSATDQPFRYALASYLMAAGDGSSITEMGTTDGYGDPTPWHPEYDWNLGTTTGPYRSVATNVFRRDFTCGTAVVNANRTATALVTVPLGARYTDHRSVTVTSVALPGTSGSVLRKACTP